MMRRVAKEQVAYTYSSPSCRGIVTNYNYIACLASIQPIPQITYNEIAESVRAYVYLQCVGFVQAIVGGITGTPMEKIANGIAFKYAPPRGYVFKAKNTPGVIIKAGDLAVWSKGEDGHVAYVVDPGTVTDFIVAEANSGIPGSVRTRYVSVNEPHFEGWAIKQ